jgi:hypothetical protein
LQEEHLKVLVKEDGFSREQAEQERGHFIQEYPVPSC